MRTLAVSIIAVLITSVSASWAKKPTRSPVSDMPFGFVGSGGISAGAFQAGLVYGVIRHLAERHDDCKGGQDCLSVLGNGRPRFVASTGASAGAINGFLAPMLWGQYPARGSGSDQGGAPTRNVIWDTWVNIGWEGLLPTTFGATTYDETIELICSHENMADSSAVLKATCAALRAKKIPGSPFDSSDGLLSRTAMLLPQLSLLCQLDSAHQECANFFPNGPPALTALSRIGDEGIRVGQTLNLQNVDYSRANPLGLRQSSFLAPMRLIVDNKRWRVESVELSGQATQPLYIKPKSVIAPRHVLDPADVIDVVKASGGYPVAFSPVRLSTSNQLGGKYKPKVFSDGGLYNNLPLGALIDLVREGPKPEDEADLKIILVDPDSRRGEPEVADTDQAQPDPRGIANAIAQGMDFLADARLAEILAYTRYRGGNEDNLIVFDRFSPTFGEMQGAFGAFFSRHFRRYDFFAGIYAAAVAILTKTQQFPRTTTQTSFCNLEAAALMSVVADGPRTQLYTYLFFREKYWRCGRTTDQATAYAEIREMLLTGEYPQPSYRGPESQWIDALDRVSGGLAVVLGDIDDARRRALISGAAPDETQGVANLQRWINLIHLLSSDPAYESVFKELRDKNKHAANSVFDRNQRGGQWVVHQLLRGFERLLDVERGDRALLEGRLAKSKKAEASQYEAQINQSRTASSIVHLLRHVLGHHATGRNDAVPAAHVSRLMRGSDFNLSELVTSVFLPYSVGYRWWSDARENEWELRWAIQHDDKWTWPWWLFWFPSGAAINLPIESVRPRLELIWGCSGSWGLFDAEGFQICPRDKDAILDRMLAWELIATYELWGNPALCALDDPDKDLSEREERCPTLGLELGVELASTVRIFGGVSAPQDRLGVRDKYGFSGGLALTNVNGFLYDSFTRSRSGIAGWTLFLPKRLDLELSFGPGEPGDSGKDHFEPGKDVRGWLQFGASVSDFCRRAENGFDGGITIRPGIAAASGLELGLEANYRGTHIGVDLGAQYRHWDAVEHDLQESYWLSTGFAVRTSHWGSPRIGLRMTPLLGDRNARQYAVTLSLAEFGAAVTRRNQCHTIHDAEVGTRACERKQP